MSQAVTQEIRALHGAGPIAWHLRQTVCLAAPIALSLLAEMAMGLISTVMLGGLGDRALAAGGLGTNLFFTALIVLQGGLSGVSVLSASALGAGRDDEVATTYWSGAALAAVFSLPLFLCLSEPSPLLRAMGEPSALTADVAAYLHVLRWAAPAGMVGVGMMRQFLPALGLQHVLLWVMPGGVVLHGFMNRLLIHGGFGYAGLGTTGSALATVVTLWALAIAMLAILHLHTGQNHLVAPAWPRLDVLRRLLAIGLPVGATVIVEAGLFLATGLVAGALGPAVLAAHMIALSVASVSFMVPLAISQAANVRVATAFGAGHRLSARRAGFCAIGLCMAFMGAAALVFGLAPHPIVAAYLGPLTPANAVTASLAARLLRVAGVFQMADGTQVAAAGALRGLQDTRIPMLLATFGYWGIGFWAGRFLAFDEHLGAVGLWWGLCAGLAAVAICLSARFALRA
jgi:MATE family multidrug resistance protein